MAATSLDCYSIDCLLLAVWWAMTMMFYVYGVFHTGSLGSADFKRGKFEYYERKHVFLALHYLDTILFKISIGP